MFSNNNDLLRQLRRYDVNQKSLISCLYQIYRYSTSLCTKINHYRKYYLKICFYQLTNN